MSVRKQRDDYLRRNRWFLPTMLRDCILFLWASHPNGLNAGTPADNDIVTTWTDLSGQSNDVTQVNAAERPLFNSGVIGIRPGLFFDGTDDELHRDDSIGLSGTDIPFTVISAINRTDSLGRNNVFAIGSSTDANPFYQQQLNATTAFEFANRDDAATAKTAAGGTPATGNYIFSIVSTGTTATIYVNGTRQGAANQDIDLGAITVDRATIGALVRSTGDTNHFQGYIGAVIGYARTLSLIECIRVERWLGHYYGIAV